MDANLLIICLLTFVIHVVGTLAYAVRHDFRYLLFTTTIATIIGALSIPTFQRVFQ